MHIPLNFIISLVIASGLILPAAADRESAETLGKRLRNSVEGMDLLPVWAPDDSALYIHQADQITRIETATGRSHPMIDFEALSREVEDHQSRIERFTVTETGELICLITTESTCRTLQITDSDINPVERKMNPFTLRPKAPDRIQRRRPGKQSAIIFINNTAEPVQLFWEQPTGNRKLYHTLAPGDSYRQHTIAGHAWIAGERAFVAEDQPAIAYIDTEPPEEREDRRTPNTPAPAENAWQHSFRENNLFVKNLESGKEIQLTLDGTAEWSYGEPVTRSPDNRYLIVMRAKAGDNRTIDLIEAAPENELQPRTLTIPYDKPGDRLTTRIPCLFDLQTMKQVPLDDSLFPNPWHINRFHWSPDSDRCFFVYNERGHQTARLLALQAGTGKIAVVTEDKSETFIDWTNKLRVHHLDTTDEAIWMSERSGWNHLYLVDRKTGKIHPITTGEWVVKSIETIDEEKREILFRACGVFPGMDPYYIQYGRIAFDGSRLTWLTEGNGTHSLSFSPGRGYYVDSWSRVDQPPIHELRRSSDGQQIQLLGKADASKLLQIHPHLPEPFCAKGRDGETDIHGVIYRPSNFDPEKKYPVIENIYAGPQDFHVPKEFIPYRNEQRLAELGFIVVKIDGMGTNWRSKKFHDVCWKNLKDAGFPDRIAWMKAAAKKYPYMDLDRVGIYGTSAGGQNAMRAVIDHADFYKAAMADCGCHDNRMDKVWWNEQWMGWPVDESYAESSNMVDAHKLGGKLLLTVGALDRNVDPSSTMQVVDALIKADREFELMVFPSAGHGAGMGAYGTRLRENFFIRHLQP